MTTTDTDTDTAIILSCHANTQQIQAALDAAVNMEIFEIAWKLFLICSESQCATSANDADKRTTLFYQRLAKQSSLLMEHTGRSRIDWVKCGELHPSEMEDFTRLTGKEALSMQSFHQILQTCRGTISF